MMIIMVMIFIEIFVLIIILTIIKKKNCFPIIKSILDHNN